MERVNDNSSRVRYVFFFLYGSIYIIDAYKSEIEDSIDNDDKTIFIAIDNEKVIGYVILEIVRFSHLPYNLSTHCVISDIMIEEEYHIMVLGKQFIEKIKIWSKSNEVYSIESSVLSKK